MKQRRGLLTEPSQPEARPSRRRCDPGLRHSLTGEHGPVEDSLTVAFRSFLHEPAGWPGRGCELPGLGGMFSPRPDVFGVRPDCRDERLRWNGTLSGSLAAPVVRADPKGAERAGIAVGDLEAQIASLNQHLGWDVRVGARPTPQPPTKPPLQKTPPLKVKRPARIQRSANEASPFALPLIRADAFSASARFDSNRQVRIASGSGVLISVLAPPMEPTVVRRRIVPRSQRQGIGQNRNQNT